jgi:hypothetical protein
MYEPHDFWSQVNKKPELTLVPGGVKESVAGSLDVELRPGERESLIHLESRLLEMPDNTLMGLSFTLKGLSAGDMSFHSLQRSLVETEMKKRGLEIIKRGKALPAEALEQEWDDLDQKSA